MRPETPVVLFADKLYSRRAIHNVDAFGLEFLFKARHQDDVADASRITVRVVKRHILVVEEVRNREFGVGRAFVIAFPERHLNVVLCGKINGPIHAGTALLGKHPKQTFVHAALAPSDQTTNNFGCVDIDLHGLLHFAAESGDVTATSRPAAGFFDDDNLGTFFGGRQGGGETGQTGTDHDNVRVDGFLDLVSRNLFHRLFPGPVRAFRLGPFGRNVTGVRSTGKRHSGGGERTLQKAATRQSNMVVRHIHSLLCL